MTTLPFHSIHKQLKTNEKEKEKIHYFRPEGSNVKLSYWCESYVDMFSSHNFICTSFFLQQFYLIW